MVSKTKVGILPDVSILREIEEGNLKITNFDRDCLQPASYDLRLEEAIKDGIVVNVAERGLLVLPWTGMVEVRTTEEIELPNYIVAHLSLRNRFAWRGIYLFGDFQIPPGYQGNLTMKLMPLIPILAENLIIRYREPFCTIEFHYVREN